MNTPLTDETWYLLPDGTAVIACINLDNGGAVLYTDAEWESNSTADYEVQDDGRVTFQGDNTGWTTDDLKFLEQEGEGR